MRAKTITFPARSATERKQRILAVAFATQKVGGWKSTNVTSDVIDYLRKDGYDVGTSRDGDSRLSLVGVVGEAMIWLTESGYAARVVRGKRTIEFVMDPDVNVPVPDYLKGKLFRESKDLGRSVVPPRRVNTETLPPLPSQVGEKFHRQLELNKALQAWAERDLNTLKEYVDAVLLDLGA